MTTIQNGNTPGIFSIPSSEVLGTGAAERSFSSKTLSKNAIGKTTDKSDGLIAHVAQHIAVGQAGQSSQPELAAPKGGTISVHEVEGLIQRMSAEPAYAEDVGRLLNPAAPSGNKKFDIMDMPLFSPADLFIALMHLLGDLRTSDAKFNSAMTVKGEAAVHRTADALIAGGNARMGTSIAQGVVSLGGAIGGASMKVVGQKKASLNTTKNIDTAQKDRILTQDLNGALNSVKNKGNATDGINTINVKSTDGSVDKKLAIEPNRATLDETDKAIIANPLNQKAAVFAAGDATASTANDATVAKWMASGDAVSALGTAASMAIGGGGSIMTASQEAVQKFSEFDTRVTGQGGDNASERSKAANALLNEMLQAMVAANQSRNATTSAVAGNIRG